MSSIGIPLAPVNWLQRRRFRPPMVAFGLFGRFRSIISDIVHPSRCRDAHLVSLRIRSVSCLLEAHSGYGFLQLLQSHIYAGLHRDGWGSFGGHWPFLVHEDVKEIMLSEDHHAADRVFKLVGAA